MTNSLLPLAWFLVPPSFLCVCFIMMIQKETQDIEVTGSCDVGLYEPASVKFHKYLISLLASENSPASQCVDRFGSMYTPTGGRPFCCVCRYFLGWASLPASPFPLPKHPHPLSFSLTLLFFLPLCGQIQRSRYPWATCCHGSGSLWHPPCTFPSSGPSGSGNGPLLLALSQVRIRIISYQKYQWLLNPECLSSLRRPVE